MSFNTIIDWNSCTAEQQRQLLMRPAISASESITRTVNDILDNVKTRGDEALREYSAKFDKTTVTALKVSADEIAAASERLSDELKQAMAVAVKNIETFHTAQKLPPVDVETQPGVRCQQVTRPVASVGLYIPGGSAPLFSTVLMLATPARIAGCKKWCCAHRRRLPMRSFMRRNCAVCRTCLTSAAHRPLPRWRLVRNLCRKWTKSSGRVTPLSPKQNASKPASGRCGDRYARRPVGSAGDC